MPLATIGETVPKRSVKTKTCKNLSQSWTPKENPQSKNASVCMKTWFSDADCNWTIFFFFEVHFWFAFDRPDEMVKVEVFEQGWIWSIYLLCSLKDRLPETPLLPLPSDESTHDYVVLGLRWPWTPFSQSFKAWKASPTDFSDISAIPVLASENLKGRINSGVDPKGVRWWRNTKENDNDADPPSIRIESIFRAIWG